MQKHTKELWVTIESLKGLHNSYRMRNNNKNRETLK